MKYYLHQNGLYKTILQKDKKNAGTERETNNKNFIVAIMKHMQNTNKSTYYIIIIHSNNRANIIN